MRQLLDLNTSVMLNSLSGHFKKVSDLDEGPNTGQDGEAQDDDLGAVVDPEHLAPELLAVLHHEEDDDDNDAANQTQEAEEES